MSSPLRAADSDREAVAATLRQAHAEGRVDTTELEERLERCYAAKTVAELDRLVDDLPRPSGRGSRRRPPLVLVPLALVLLALAAATHGHALVVVPFVLFAVLRFGRGRPLLR